MQRVRIDPRSKLRVLVYGKPGSGKTTFAATAALDPRTTPVLWIDAGGNPISIAHTFARAGMPIDETKVTVLRMDAITDLTDIYAWLAAGQPEDAFAKNANIQSGYKTVVFDGFTHIQRLSFENVQNTANLMPGQNAPKPQWTHFRSVLGQMIIIASKFYTLPLHIIATALEDTDIKYRTPGNPDTQYNYYQPLFSGQTLHELPAWALNVGRMTHIGAFDRSMTGRLPDPRELNSAKTIVQFERTEYVDAKNQHGIADFYVNPAITAFLDAIYAKAPSKARSSDIITA